MNRQLIYIAIALVGILVVIISLGLYLIPAVHLTTTKSTVEMVYPYNYIENGLFSPKRYLEYTLIPTRATKPDTPYLIIVDNGLLRREDKVKWSSLELGIFKPKTITHSLTADEYTAISVLPKYDIAVYEIRPERDMNYLMMPFIYLGLLSLAILAGFGRKQQQRIAEPYKKVIREPSAAPPEPISKDQIDRCFNCDDFKSINGVLQCKRDKCKYT